MSTRSVHAGTATGAGARRPRRLEAAAYGGPDVLRVTEDDPADPTDPAPDEARVRVLASSLTLSDSIVRRGLNPYTGSLTPPITLGYDFVGIVDAVGDDVSDLAVGDLVADLVRWGGNADLVTRPAASLTRLDIAADPALVEPLVMTGVTAYQALHRVAGLQAGETVLVHGATGGVGLLAVDLAGIAGARVIATGSPAKHPALVARGATAVDGRAGDLTRRVRALAPDGVDIVLDLVGGPSRQAVGDTLRPDGILVALGYAEAAGRALDATADAAAHAAQAFAEGREILAALVRDGRRTAEYDVGGSRERDRRAYDDDLHTLAGHLVAGRLRPVVRRVTLDDAVAAHRDLDRSAVTGRLVLDHGQDPVTRADLGGADS